MRKHRVELAIFQRVRGWLILVMVVGSCAAPPKAGELAVASTGKRANSPVGSDQPVTLFDGKTLNGWRVPDEFDFARHGEVSVKDEAIVLEAGSPATGIVWAGEPPRETYEITLEAMRVEGNDFFCGMTFPVGPSPCTLILGGWGGNVVGLSNIDGDHAAENQTTTGMSFQNGRWYAVRLRVTTARIEVWIDQEKMIDLERGNHRFTIWPEQEPMKPLGIATWYTKAALRNIRLAALPAEPER